jgi:hypothetical protein
VGELIGEIHAEERFVVVPTTCLAATYSAIGYDGFAVGQLARLRTVSRMVFQPLVEERAEAVGGFATTVGGDLAMGHALDSAVVHDAYYATMQPKLAAEVLPPWCGIIDLSG